MYNLPNIPKMQSNVKGSALLLIGAFICKSSSNSTVILILAFNASKTLITVENLTSLALFSK